nr:hypothetical protein [Tanacetum cinerariifolium]
MEALMGCLFAETQKKEEEGISTDVMVPIPSAPVAAGSTHQAFVGWNAIYDAHNEVACLMLGSMTLKLHMQFKNFSPYDMIQEVRSMFEKQAGVERVYLKRLLHLKSWQFKVVESKNPIRNRKMLKGWVKEKSKGKDKLVNAPKPKNFKPSAKEHQAKDDAYHHYKERFTDYGISVSKNDVLYFNVIPRDGIYEIDMLNLVPNVNSIYNVSNKRAKHNLNTAYSWHCRLAHISKKRIEKLQHDRLLNSIDDESFDQCVSCLSGKMTRKPFRIVPEERTDLLGLIHTDVCGPLRHVSRQGASYFITFTNNFSSHGYVYLLKHKREVFETFKVFNNKVVNQLGKTIKALRLDRGGEYISQEFKDYLKACEIFQLLTPLYTPQHNSVLERRNLTLLDMVRSMMNLTTVPLSFLGLCSRVCGRTVELKENQDEDTSPSENTSEIPAEVKGFKPPQEDEAPVRRCMQSMKNNQVWCLVDLPPNGKTVGGKWIFKKKTNMDGNVHTYIACLEAKGYTQTYEVDYEETLSHITDIRVVRVRIAITAFYDYEIWQMDIKNAFLNGYLDEDIYMVQPRGFVDPKHPKKASGSNVTFLVLYADDIIIMGNHISMLQSVKTYLGKSFVMKDLGDATFILAIKIYRARSKRLIRLSQSAYMDKILIRFMMDNSKRGNIPMQERLDLNKTQGASTPEEVKRMQNVPYASSVGSIMYAVRCTRLDVAFA